MVSPRPWVNIRTRHIQSRRLFNLLLLPLPKLHASQILHNNNNNLPIPTPLGSLHHNSPIPNTSTQSPISQSQPHPSLPKNHQPHQNPRIDRKPVPSSATTPQTSQQRTTWPMRLERVEVHSLYLLFVESAMWLAASGLLKVFARFCWCVAGRLGVVSSR